MLALAVMVAILSGGLQTLSNGPQGLIIQTLAGLVAYGFLTWALGMKGLGLSATDLRWTTVAGRRVAGSGWGCCSGSWRPSSQ